MPKVTSKFPGKKILIADDYFINQEVAQDILELMEFTVDVAENGRDAVKKFQHGQYDAVLMDIQMPEMDGYEAAEKIREIEGSGKHTPIIALTASVLVGEREKCLKAGMDDYISKPIEAVKLEQILKKHIPN